MNTSIPNGSNVPVLLTVKQFPQKHPAFSEGSLRWLIFNARERKSSKGTIPSNGLEEALIRVGKRLYIDEGRFFIWLESQQRVDGGQ